MVYFFLDSGNVQSNNLLVLINNRTTIDNDPSEFYIINDGIPNQDNNSYVLLNQSRVLQFIRIEKNSSGYMALCEIEVFINGKQTIFLQTPELRIVENCHFVTYIDAKLRKM